MTRIQKVYTFTNEEVNTIMDLVRAEMIEIEDEIGYTGQGELDVDNAPRETLQRYDILHDIYTGF